MSRVVSSSCRWWVAGVALANAANCLHGHARDAVVVEIQAEGAVIMAAEPFPAGEAASLPDEEPVVEVVVDEAPVPPAGAGGGFLGLGLRAMFNAIAAPQPQQVQQPVPVDEAADGEMPKDPAQAQLWQQRKQIRQQAKHMEQLFQPVLRTELEMVRQACPDLPPEARREVLAAGRAAVTKTALEFATRQMLGGQPRRRFDARRSVQAAIATALEPHASADQLATYEREQQARNARRAAAARVAIVAKLDRQLQLSAKQRRAIEDDLEAGWDDGWVRELDENGVVINSFRPAPDYANARIEPHLDDEQRAEWKVWRTAAGTGVVGMNFGLHFDGQGLHQEDDWWTQGATP